MNVFSNIATLRRKRVLIPTLAAVAVLGVGATAWSATAGDELPGSERDRVAEAATRTVEGTVIDAEKSDDPGEAYEVEVRTADGTEVDVVLDDDLEVVRQDADDTDGADDADDADDADEAADDDAAETGPDTDDRLLTDAERASAEQAALDAVGGGTVVDVEASDDPGVAYDVEVRAADGAEWDVDLDADFRVVRHSLSD